MPICDFFLSKGRYQSHVQSFGKLLRVFRNFFANLQIFISIVAKWGNLDLLRFCYELRCASIDCGSLIKTKVEVMLQANECINPKQYNSHFSVHGLVASGQGFTFAICPDDGTTICFFFCFLRASSQVFGCVALKIQSQLSITTFENFVLLNLEYR